MEEVGAEATMAIKEVGKKVAMSSHNDDAINCCRNESRDDDRYS